MGRFLDAYNASEQARQSLIEEERRKAAVEQQKKNDAFKAATKWISEVLMPVVLEVRSDLQRASGQVETADHGLTREVVISLPGRQVTTLRFQVHGTGNIDAHGGSHHGKRPLGTILDVDRDQIREFFEATISAMIPA